MLGFASCLFALTASGLSVEIAAVGIKRPPYNGVIALVWWRMDLLGRWAEVRNLPHV
jgi:hypothetical protein